MNRLPRSGMTLLPLAAALLVAAPGCGYQTGGSSSSSSGSYHWGGLYREDVHTVAVPIFTSKSFRRGVEFQLTDALVKKIEAFTPYKVVARDHADTILEGEIVSTRVNTLSLNARTGEPQEQLYSITVNFTWKDLRTGKILVERREFQDTASYFPINGESEFYGSQDTSERLALSIVHEMQNDW